MALTCHGGSTDERFLSESSRSYISAYCLSVFGLLATVLSTFKTNQPRFKFSLNSPWAISTDRQDVTYERNANMYERLDSLEKRSSVEPP